MKTFIKVLGIIGITLVSLILFKFVNIIIGITFFIIGIGLLVYFGFTKCEFSKSDYFHPGKDDIEELVVAICNEDVSWIDNYANKYKLITVYNKCDNVVKFKSDNVKVIKCPNIGSCDYAYLSYIIDRYDNLPDYIEFTKGANIPKGEYNKCKQCKNNRDLKKLMEFSISDHKFGNKENQKYSKYNFQRSGYKNMGEWINDNEFLNEKMYEENICNIIYGGQFGTTSEQIKKTPLKIWEKLRSMQKYQAEEVDHFIERTWRILLCKYKYKLVIVAIFKNETVAMKEWLQHYIIQGVEHFYMIDNDSTDDWETKVKDFPITIYTNKEKHKQKEHYNYYIEEIKKTSEWVMVVDLDEFMYAREPYNTIPQYLDTLDKDIGQVSVKWKMFGSNGHIKQPESIINGFTKRCDCIDNNEKSICRTYNLKKFNIHSHEQNGKEINLQVLKNSPLHLNHYAIQSWDWFKKIKMTRGAADSISSDNVRDENYFKKYDRNDIIDTELSNIIRDY